MHCALNYKFFGPHAGIAGVLGAIEYLAWIGQTFGSEYGSIHAGSIYAGGMYANRFTSRRLHLKQGMKAFQEEENETPQGSSTSLRGRYFNSLTYCLINFFTACRITQ